MSNYFSAVKKVNPRGVEDDVLEIFVDTYDIYRLNNLVAEAGTYTFVVWYSAKADCNITFNILGTEEKVAACATWGKLVKTVEYSGIGSNNIDITQDLGSTIYLYEAYITKGSQDKSWSLAPEDWEYGREERDTLINETMTFAQQTSDKFNWVVKSGTDETNFTLTSRTADLVSEQINLRGLVSFTSLNSVDFGSTNIIVRAGELMNAKLSSDGTIESLAGDAEGDGTIFYSRVMNDFIPVTAGEKLTFSQIFDKNNYGDNFFRYCFYQNDKTTLVQYGHDNSEKFTFAVPENAAYLRVSYDGANKVKLERSGDASTWSIADYLLGETAEGQTIIHGAYIKTGTITSEKMDVDDFFANEAVISNLKAIEIDAERITSGYIHTDRLDLHGLSVKHKSKVNANGMAIETLGISDNGDVTLRGSIESYDYVAGKTGWSINSEGSAEYNDVIVRGSVIGNYGGIASCGGSGTNLFLNSSFYNKTTQTVWNTELNGNYVADNWGGYNSGIPNLDSAYHAHLYELDGEWVYRYVNETGIWLGVSQSVADSIIPGNTYTFSCDIRRPSDSAASIKVGLYATLTDGTEGFTSGDTFALENTLYDTWERVEYTFTANANIDTSEYTHFYIYGHYGGTGTVYMRRPKLEEGNVATAWSLSPNDGIKQVIHWAGAPYENREKAPWRVYSDGSMISTEGEFSGVFTGDIKIGNISIVDPRSNDGGDATLTIQNGNDGTKAVQLRDTELSSFSQNIEIGRYFYGSDGKEDFTANIYLGQDGNARFSNGIVVGDVGSGAAKIDKRTITLDNSSIISADASHLTVFSTQFDIGTPSFSNDLTVYGDTTLNGQLQLNSTLLFGNVVKCTVTSNGLNFNFVN